MAHFRFFCVLRGQPAQFLGHFWALRERPPLSWRICCAFVVALWGGPLFCAVFCPAGRLPIPWRICVVLVVVLVAVVAFLALRRRLPLPWCIVCMFGSCGGGLCFRLAFLHFWVLRGGPRFRSAFFAHLWFFRGRPRLSVLPSTQAYDREHGRAKHVPLFTYIHPKSDHIMSSFATCFNRQS